LVYLTIIESTIIRPESAAGLIGLINLQKKLTGKRSAGKPHAAFDEAGAGNGLIEYRASLRPYWWGRADKGFYGVAIEAPPNERGGKR
jgi:hypothetical protein